MRPWLYVALLGVLCASCQSVDEAHQGDLSLIWISLDTLRADHLGLYGYDQATSPFMDALGGKGLYFEWVVAPQNSTLPSHLTMFTGFHPIVHGIYHGRRRPGLRLANSVRTLPKVLSDAGFTNFARVDDGWLQGKFGFSDGFDLYDETESPLSEKLQGLLVDIDALESDQRFFYMIHTYAIHAPYEPPESYADVFGPPDPANEAASSLSLYDASIRFVDDELGAFVAELEERGRLQSTLLVITSDHGESFAEYGIADIGHTGNNLHQNITRVPWIVLHPDPGIRGRIDATVGLIDFPNTTLAMLGVEERLPGGGRDVLGSQDLEAIYLSWTGNGAFSLTTRDHHLLWSQKYPGPERNSLFETGPDPLEMNPIQASALNPALAERLLTEIETLEADEQRIGLTLRERYDVPEETLRRLRALGYID